MQKTVYNVTLHSSYTIWYNTAVIRVVPHDAKALDSICVMSNLLKTTPNIIFRESKLQNRYVKLLLFFKYTYPNFPFLGKAEPENYIL